MSEVRVAQPCLTLCDPMGHAAHELSRPEYWSGYLFPSPGDLPNPGLPHCRRILYQLSHQGSPKLPGILNDQHISRHISWHPTPVFLPGKSHGQRSLAGCSLWGCQESDTTERLHFQFSLSCFEEGNGNPLQCSCPKTPRDGEPGGLLSVGSRRVRHDCSDFAAAAAAAAAETNCCSVAQSCRLCNFMNCGTPGFPVLPYLSELAQTHVH